VHLRLRASRLGLVAEQTLIEKPFTEAIGPTGYRQVAELRVPAGHSEAVPAFRVDVKLGRNTSGP
jgi:hypothetical protein